MKQNATYTTKIYKKNRLGQFLLKNNMTIKQYLSLSTTKKEYENFLQEQQRNKSFIKKLFKIK